MQAVTADRFFRISCAASLQRFFRRFGQLAVFIEATVNIHAGNLIFAVKRISNGRSAVFANVFQRFIESRPRFGIVAFGIIPCIAIDRAFAEFVLFGTLPRFNSNPILTRFHLVGNCCAQCFFSFGKSRFRFLARSFVFRSVCAFVFSSNRFTKIFCRKFRRFLFLALIVCKAHFVIVMQT